MTKSRIANPGPAAIWIANPRKKRKGKSMAKAKRKGGVRRAVRRTTARRTTSRRIHRAANPHPVRHHVRRRGAVARVRRHRVTRRRRHSNPFGGSLLAKGIVLAIGAAGIQFVMTFVPQFGGVSAPADALRTVAVGWLASIGMKKTGILGRYADDVFLAAATLAGGKIVSAILVPFALRLFPQRAPAPAPEAVAAGVQGIATLYPGMHVYQGYRGGMNGIATWYPGMNPYQQYQAGGGVPIA